ncbi:MAG: hypothetical protein SWK76_05920 [Actinomycetota bacterium]|nr:hypothetical protein [Actinomycetota bacterium]
MNPDEFDTPPSYYVQKLQPYFYHVDEPIIYEYRKWSNDIRCFYISTCYGFEGYTVEVNDEGEVREYIDRLSTKL